MENTIRSDFWRARRTTMLVARDGDYEACTSAAAFDLIEAYRKTVLGVIGITDVKFVNVGGTAQVLVGGVDREVFLRPVLERVRERLHKFA
jgi:FMN-dependent NADH-azoreductase